MIIRLENWMLNYILKTLAEKPYNEVAGIIQHIKNQIDNVANEEE